MFSKEDMEKLFKPVREIVTKPRVRATASVEDYVGWFRSMSDEKIESMFNEEDVKGILQQVADRGTNLELVQAAVELGKEIAAGRFVDRVRNGDPAHEDFAKRHPVPKNFGNLEPHEM